MSHVTVPVILRCAADSTVAATAKLQLWTSTMSGSLITWDWKLWTVLTALAVAAPYLIA